MEEKNKIKVCQMCFEDSDLKKDEVEIISEDECIENHDKELKGNWE